MMAMMELVACALHSAGSLKERDSPNRCGKSLQCFAEHKEPQKILFGCSD